MNSKVFIIAEAGVNHNGSVEIAKELIDAAAESGADAVKFQTFKAEDLVVMGAKKAVYQLESTGRDESQLEMLKRLELSYSDFETLFKYCREKGIIFLSSPFGLESIEFLNSLGMNIFKIPSGEITNLPYLRKIGTLKQHVILSTGMSELYEIGDALKILTDSGTAKEDITILHCNTAYPTPFEDVNLLAMQTISKEFDVEVGYSDHTLGIEVSIAAVALGARVIEKHFTIDRKMLGPDHKSSLEPSELTQMIKSIRNIEIALGDGIKKPSFSEVGNKIIARKSLVASVDIKKGEIFSKGNITAKRPGFGISPMNWHSVIGKVAPRNFRKDDLIEL